uniref:Uncharacterized protein n=1 Tax=Cacopsylla melanoneura TaxID=428564 RepID=A0A8D8M8A8_9HEMI
MSRSLLVCLLVSSVCTLKAQEHMYITKVKAAERNVTNAYVKAQQEQSVTNTYVRARNKSSFYAGKVNTRRINNRLLKVEDYGRMRSSNVIVYGIPEKVNEDIRQTGEEIGHRLDIKDPLKDIVKIFRYRSRKQPRPVLIVLQNSLVKTKWVMAYRNKQMWNEKWYLHEHLAKGTLELVLEVKNWAQSKHYSHIWTWNSDVYYKKAMDSHKYKVLSMHHLHQLKMNEAKVELVSL